MNAHAKSVIIHAARGGSPEKHKTQTDIQTIHPRNTRRDAPARHLPQKYLQGTHNLRGTEERRDARSHRCNNNHNNTGAREQRRTPTDAQRRANVTSRSHRSLSPETRRQKETSTVAELASRTCANPLPQGSSLDIKTNEKRRTCPHNDNNMSILLALHRGYSRDGYCSVRNFGLRLQGVEMIASRNEEKKGAVF